MKRFFALLIATLVAGYGFTACGNLVPPALTAAPTLRAEPSTIPTARSFTGTEISFDRLSMVIPTGVAAGGSGMLVPEAKGDDVAPWDVAPEHIQLKLDGYALVG